MDATLESVAKQVRLHKGSVSRILNGKGDGFSAETQQRVLLAAAEMGYRPNRAARALTTGRTHMIALCGPNLHSLYSARIIYQISQTILSHGYDLLVSEARLPSESTGDMHHLAALPVDGILLSDMPDYRLSGLQDSLLRGKPVVSVGTCLASHADHVRFDILDSVIEAVQHLYDQGCRRIAFLLPAWGKYSRENGDARVLGYESAIAQVGLEPALISAEDGSLPQVGPALSAYIGQQGSPDGLLCYNDEMAMAALRVFCDLGIQVPEDVAVVGCDGLIEAAYLNPSLTTISLPIREMLSEAWTLLEKRIVCPSLPIQRTVLPAHLEVRHSSCRRKAGRIEPNDPSEGVVAPGTTRHDHGLERRK